MGRQTIGHSILAVLAGMGLRHSGMYGEYAQFLGFTVGKGLCSFRQQATHSL